MPFYGTDFRENFMNVSYAEINSKLENLVYLSIIDTSWCPGHANSFSYDHFFYFNSSSLFQSEATAPVCCPRHRFRVGNVFIFWLNLTIQREIENYLEKTSILPSLPDSTIFSLREWQSFFTALLIIANQIFFILSKFIIFF